MADFWNEMWWVFVLFFLLLVGGGLSWKQNHKKDE